MKSTPRTRKYRASNPLRYVWQNLKDNAKRRGKEFTLTFEQWESFLSTNNYMEERGRGSDSLNIDRRVNSQGYDINNIQVLDGWSNRSKGVHDDGNPCPF